MPSTDLSSATPAWLALALRPYSDQGLLLAAAGAPLTAEEIRQRALPTMVGHLRSVCEWRHGADGAGWRLGDYAYYVLNFRPADGVQLYVQLWSEPEQPVLLEVCSGAWNSAVAEHLSAAVRERIHDHGFAIGGAAENYQKSIVVSSPDAIEALARETLEVLTRVLGYDGTLELQFQRCLESRATADWVYRTVTRSMVESVLQQAGYVLDPTAESRRTVIAARSPDYPVLVLLGHEAQKGSGDFTVVRLRSAVPCPRGMAEHRVAKIHEHYAFVTAQPEPARERVLLDHSLLLDGGVTAGWLQTQFRAWKGLLQELVEK